MVDGQLSESNVTGEDSGGGTNELAEHARVVQRQADRKVGDCLQGICGEGQCSARCLRPLDELGMQHGVVDCTETGQRAMGQLFRIGRGSDQIRPLGAFPRKSKQHTAQGQEGALGQLNIAVPLDDAHQVRHEHALGKRAIQRCHATKRDRGERSDTRIPMGQLDLHQVRKQGLQVVVEPELNHMKGLLKNRVNTYLAMVTDSCVKEMTRWPTAK